MKEITTIISRGFKRQWVGETLPPEDELEERQLIETYKPLLAMFCVSEEAAAELTKFLERRPGLFT